MKSRHRYITAIGAISCGLLVHTAVAGTPLGTAFTYQGQLDQSGARFTGTANMDFKLFDAASGGAQIGSTVSLVGVVVTDGIFTEVLDFGPSAFADDARFLEITVNGTALSPLQPLTATPYSLQTRKLFVNGTTGDVGIGTTTPGAQLHIDGGSSFINLLVEGDCCGTSGRHAQFGIKGGVSGSPQLMLFATASTNGAAYGIQGVRAGVAADGRLALNPLGGNVGIGTTAPATKLHVSGSDNTGTTATLKITSGSQNMLLDGNEICQAENGPLFLNFNTTGDVILAGGASGGDVGIGTFTPATKLHVKGAAGPTQLRVESPLGQNASLLLQSGTADQGVLFLNSTSNIMSLNNLVTGGQLRLATQNSPRLTILGDGRVGIGTTNPATRLHVSGTTTLGNTNVNGLLRCNGDLRVRTNLLFADFSRFQVGIGRNPLRRLDVNGQVRASSFAFISDLVYKQDILPLSGALDKVLLLRGVSYTWNQVDYPEMDFEDGPQCGFIAQEVMGVVPEAVFVDEEGIHSLNSASLVPLLVESIKEQQAQIETMQAQIVELTALLSNHTH